MDALAKSFRRERRISPRYDIATALRIRVWNSRAPEELVKSINLSNRGILFATNSIFREGEAVRVLLKMPLEVSGEPAREWLCTGLVVRVQSLDGPQGKLRVGVRFDCYEISPRPRPTQSEPSVLHDC